jgi:hypothetical protein
MVDPGNCFMSFAIDPSDSLRGYLDEIEKLEDTVREKSLIKVKREVPEAPKDMKYDDKETYKIHVEGSERKSLLIKSEKTSSKIRFYRMSTILYYLINRHNNRFMNKWGLWIISVVIAIVRGWLGSFIILQKKKLFYGQSGLEVTTMILNSLHQVYVYYIVARVVTLMIKDFSREYYLQVQLEVMLEPYRVFTDKFLPTLNFLDPNNAATWLKIKKLSGNYGL